MDRFDAIENVVSIEQCRSILSWSFHLSWGFSLANGKRSRTQRLDHWYSPSSLRIAHVRYIKILTWLRGFLVIFLYLVRFGFLCARVSSGNCETIESWKFATLTLKPQSRVRILKYRTWTISAQKLLCTNSQTLYSVVSYFLINQSKL